MKYFALSLFLLLGHLVSAQQCIQTTCSTDTLVFQDLSPNLEFYWNEPSFNDVVNGTKNLSEGPVDLVFQVEDTCANNLFSIEFELFLDLDGNGSMETVVPSWNLSTAGNVNYGNAFDPMFNFGDTSAFDTRPVQAADKFQFALDISGTSVSKTAKLRWNTASFPDQYVLPELPYGSHRIVWKASNNAGEQRTCVQLFQVRDGKAPVVVCLNGLAANIMPTQQITLWASDFLQYAEDNSTPANLLKIGVRRSGTGTGFPVGNDGNPLTSVIFDCNDIGTQFIELWAMDSKGNADYCETYVIINDPFGVCSGANTEAKICVRRHCDGAVISELALNVTSSSEPPINVALNLDTLSGCYRSDLFVPPGSSLFFQVFSNSNPLNGVDVLDMIKIRKHILGIESLDTYNLIAADANKSGSITTFDIVEIRKLVTGNTSTFSSNLNWRFIDATYVFPNLQNPFQSVFPEIITAPNPGAALEGTFYGVKVGDVDCSAWPGNGLQGEKPDDREKSVLYLSDLTLRTGESKDISLMLENPDQWAGLQAAINFDPELLEVQVLDGTDLPDMSPECYHFMDNGTLKLAWFTTNPLDLGAQSRALVLRLRAKKTTRMSEAISLDETALTAKAYDALERAHGLALEFRAVDAPGISAQPNPTTAGFALPIKVGQAGMVYFRVFDASGRLTWSMSETYTIGEHRIEVPASALPNNGIYFWELKGVGESNSGKVSKIK
jgi:hypothetical protein